MTLKKLILLLLISVSVRAEQYKGITNSLGVIRQSDGAAIPADPGNRDWATYQIWLASGNVTTPADPPPSAADILADQRGSAIFQVGADTSGTAKAFRAVLLTVIDELNLLRERDNDRAADVAAATSLADLKVRWAAKTSMPDRTVSQAKTAVQNKITSGTAD